MSFFVHTLEYKGGPVISDISPRNYKATDYNQYKYKYENSFYPMRNMLGLPRECCKTSDELLKNRDNIFVLEDNGEIIGSVAIYSNEIDDLFEQVINVPCLRIEQFCFLKQSCSNSKLSCIFPPDVLSLHIT